MLLSFKFTKFHSVFLNSQHFSNTQNPHNAHILELSFHSVIDSPLRVHEVQLHNSLTHSCMRLLCVVHYLFIATTVSTIIVHREYDYRIPHICTKHIFCRMFTVSNFFILVLIPDVDTTVYDLSNRRYAVCSVTLNTPSRYLLILIPLIERLLS